MTTPAQWDNLIGHTAVGSDGGKLGKIGQIYLDEMTGRPTWVTVSTGLFGTRQSFAPLDNADIRGDQLVLAVPQHLVKDAPNVEDDGHLNDSETLALYQHYADYLDLGPGRAGERSSDTGRGWSDTGTVAAGAQGHDTSGPTTDEAMTRSEERLHVGTETMRAGRARLRKYVVTENVSTTVPVSHEEVRIEREPITEANIGAAMSGPDISEEEHEVILHAERPVVAKETVPVERVRLSTETVTEQHQVNEQLRKERIDEPDIDSGDPGQER
jgi:uncharacterized protein (TIGR02271 family)